MYVYIRLCEFYLSNSNIIWLNRNLLGRIVPIVNPKVANHVSYWWRASKHINSENPPKSSNPSLKNRMFSCYLITCIVPVDSIMHGVAFMSSKIEEIAGMFLSVSIVFWESKSLSCLIHLCNRVEEEYVRIFSEKAPIHSSTHSYP